MLRTFIKAAVIPLILAFSCSGMHRPALDQDFIDPCDGRSHDCASDTIKALESALLERGADPEIYRRLAVCYRAAGTPGSRLRSMQAIDMAIELDPDNPLFHVEKGLTLYAGQFTGSAIMSLDRAIRIDPGCFQAWYQKGRIEKDLYLRDMCSERHLEDAIRFFSRADDICGDHDETLFWIGLLQYLRGRLDISASYALRGEELYPASFRYRMLSSCVALESMRFEDASEGFELALALMDGNTRDMYEDVSMLLPDIEIDRYIHLDGRNWYEFNRKFWVMNDPTPATILNERRLEHYRRIFLASELLSDKRLDIEGAGTSRGAAIVSYGLPDAIILDMGSGLDGPFVVWTYLRGENTLLLLSLIHI